MTGMLIDKLLAVADAIPPPFTLADLVVAAWRSYPKEFGLRGYNLPDAAKVYAKVYGATGIIAQGHLAAVANSTDSYRFVARPKKPAKRKDGRDHVAEERSPVLLVDVSACCWCGANATTVDEDGDPSCEKCVILSGVNPLAPRLGDTIDSRPVRMIGEILREPPLEQARKGYALHEPVQTRVAKALDRLAGEELRAAAEMPGVVEPLNIVVTANHERAPLSMLACVTSTGLGVGPLVPDDTVIHASIGTSDYMAPEPTTERCACGEAVSDKPTRYVELRDKCARCRRRWHADGGLTQKHKRARLDGTYVKPTYAPSDYAPANGKTYAANPFDPGDTKPGRRPLKAPLREYVSLATRRRQAKAEERARRGNTR